MGEPMKLNAYLRYDPVQHDDTRGDFLTRAPSETKPVFAS